MKKHCLLLYLVAFICFYSLNNCAPTESPKPTGRAIFWTKSRTLGGAWIDVFINGVKEGRIADVQPTEPACGANSGLTVVKNEGTYNIRAVGEDGTVWENAVLIKANECYALEIK